MIKDKNEIPKFLKEKERKCKLWQIRLKCLSCGKVYCRSIPLYSCLECGGILSVDKK